MSMRMRNLCCVVAKLFHRDAARITIRNFSRKSVNSDGTYKPVKPRKPKKREENKTFITDIFINNITLLNYPRKTYANLKYVLEETALAWRDPNFDILASKCFPFFMHGNIGPAWYDTYTTIKDNNGDVHLLEDIEKSENIGCKIQACPQVLRHTVYDLFPSRNFDQSTLSVITLTIKPDLTLLRKNNEIETEKLAQLFVLSAKTLCTKLRRNGYWADFINPFSGKPYYTLIPSDALYKTDEKFRCLDFQIYAISECLIVSNEADKSKRTFIGSLFTNAPSNKTDMDSLMTSSPQAGVDF